MSDVIPVSVAWLALREQADARSRSRALAAEAARVARVPAVVHDLGSGTGSMMRWLAPLLPGPQTWVLHDWNAALLDRAAETSAVPGDVVVRTRVTELGGLRDGDLSGATLVTMSALLDVLTREEIEAVARACVSAGAPALFTLSVTGRVALDPVDPVDDVLASAFNDHQRRTIDARRLLGPDAVAATIELFRAAGWSTRVAESPWRLGASDHVLAGEWLEGWVAAAVEQRPDLREPADEHLRTRRTQLADGALAVTVHHLDLLAWPP